MDCFQFLILKPQTKNFKQLGYVNHIHNNKFYVKCTG